MKTKSMVAVGASALLAVTAFVPATSASAKGGNGTLCNNGLFHVIHKGNKINKVNVKQGYYKIYHRHMSCGASSSYLTQWLGTGKTTNNFLVATGTRGKKSTMFIQGQSGPFFQIKWVKGG